MSRQRRLSPPAPSGTPRGPLSSKLHGHKPAPAILASLRSFWNCPPPHLLRRVSPLSAFSQGDGRLGSEKQSGTPADGYEGRQRAWEGGTQRPSPSGSYLLCSSRCPSPPNLAGTSRSPPTRWKQGGSREQTARPVSSAGPGVSGPVRGPAAQEGRPAGQRPQLRLLWPQLILAFPRLSPFGPMFRVSPHPPYFKKAFTNEQPSRAKFVRYLLPFSGDLVHSHPAACPRKRGT